MVRGRFFVFVVFAVVLLCATGACKPKPGDSCAQGRMACVDPTTGIFCAQDGKFATMSCRGGCSVSGGTLTCNNDISAEKDGCALVGDAACTKDNRSALQCGTDNKFAVVETCKGARGCSISGDRIDCDNDTSDIGDPCRVAGDYACTPDKGLALRCDDHKMAPLNTCRGPKACRVIELPQEHRVDFVCDDSKAQEGDACDTNGEGAAADAQADSDEAEAAASPNLPKIPGTITIMPIGDSITRVTCWRAQLWKQLNATFPSRFHLVGTLNSDSGCNVPGYDTANQGYSSSLITEVVAGITTARSCSPLCPALSDLQTAFNTVMPSVALIHYGTNDVWNSKLPADILNAYSAVIDALRAANPSVVVFLAQIIPMNVTASTCSGCSCPFCPTEVPALNKQIATWAPTKSTAASPVVVVDQYTGFDAMADTVDGVHPNASGSQKMAANWYAALAPLF